MGFLFGLLVGGAMMSGGSSGVPSLGAIPFRCLAAFDVSETEYRTCRRPSLKLEVWTYTGCGLSDHNAKTGSCSVEQHLSWEANGLHDLRNAMKQKEAKK